MTNNSSLPCDIVQDLLPSYADGILSDTGTAVVAKHLQSCEHCHDIYHAMVNDEPHKATSDQQEKEIDKVIFFLVCDSYEGSNNGGL